MTGDTLLCFFFCFCNLGQFCATLEYDISWYFILSHLFFFNFILSIIMMMVIAIMTHIELQQHNTGPASKLCIRAFKGSRRMMNACASCNHGCNGIKAQIGFGGKAHMVERLHLLSTLFNAIWSHSRSREFTLAIEDTYFSTISIITGVILHYYLSSNAWTMKSQSIQLYVIGPLLKIKSSL